MQSKLIVIALGLCMGCSVAVAGKNNDSASSSLTVNQVSRGGGVEWVEEAGIIQRKELTAGGPEGGVEEAGNRHAQEISSGGAEEEGTREAGKVGGAATEEAGSVETDQAEESETGGDKSENELIAEVRKHLDGRTTEHIDTDPFINAEGKSSSKSKLEVLDNHIKYSNSNKTEDYTYGHQYFRTRSMTISFQDIGKIEISDMFYDEYPIITITCKNKKPCVELKRTNEDSGSPEMNYSGDQKEKRMGFPGRSDFVGLFDGNLQAAENAVKAVNNLIAHYDGGGDTSTGQPAKCYNWVNLGTFHLGKWTNGNGRETRALDAGLNTKIWDDETLLKDYKIARESCVFNANDAMNSAITAMVLIGRKAKDVDNEKKRIKDFYQANLDKCQAEFKKRFLKYENKFCD